MDKIHDIRLWMRDLWKNKIFVPDKSGVDTVEILGAQFIADEPTIFGAVNEDYIQKELNWYKTESRNINDMTPPIPKIWKEVASRDGIVNSNYGYLVGNEGNHSQYQNCFLELKKNPWSRRAIMIYTRPSIWKEYDIDGMSDFICTNTVQYFIRRNPNERNIDRLFSYVNMRSNDVWSGYRNDYAWQRFIFDQLYNDLADNYADSTHFLKGAIIWNVGSLHMYEPQFYLLDHFSKTGQFVKGNH